MKSLARSFTVVTAVLLLAGVVGAQSVIPITLDEPRGPEESSPRELTKQKLAAKGKVGGKESSVSISMQETSLSMALDYLTQVAGAPPRGIKIVVDRERFPRDALERKVTVDAKDVSLEQALRLVLPGYVGYRVLEDGTVLVSARDALYEEQLPTRTYDVRAVMEVLALAGRDEMVLKQVIERAVRAPKPSLQWDSENGRSRLTFVEPGLLLVNATDEMHDQVIGLCKNILLAEKRRMEGLSARLEEAENRLGNMVMVERPNKQAQLMRTYVEASPPARTVERALVELERWRGTSRTIALELAGAKAKLAAIEKQIADINRRAAAAVNVDPVIARLKTVLKLRDEALTEALKHPEANLAQFRERLAEAQVKLAARRQEVAEAAGKALLVDLNNQMGRVLGEIARLKGQQQITKEQLAQLGSERTREVVQAFERFKAQLERLDRRIRAQQALVDALRRQVEGTPEVAPRRRRPPRRGAFGAGEKDMMPGVMMPEGNGPLPVVPAGGGGGGR